MAMLIAGRAVQGSAAGGVVILVNVCVSDLFSMRLVIILWFLIDKYTPS